MPENGRLPDKDLSPTLLIGRLRHDAAASADRMALAFYEDLGFPLVAVSPADTYRDYNQQVQARARVGNLAAPPGTSNHGWGTAVDLASGMNSWSSPAQQWFAKHGRDYGWVTPGWATPGHPDFQKNEPWHKEYHPELDRKRGAQRPRCPGAGEVGFGERGTDVRKVQELLNANLQPENRITVDSSYGWATLMATVKFQRSRGLAVTGTVGPMTLARLSRTNQEDDMFSDKDKAKLDAIHSEITSRVGDVATEKGLTWRTALERLLLILRRTEARVVALAAALEAVSTSAGADSAAITRTVDAAVTKALKSLEETEYVLAPKEK